MEIFYTFLGIFTVLIAFRLFKQWLAILKIRKSSDGSL